MALTADMTLPFLARGKFKNRKIEKVLYIDKQVGTLVVIRRRQEVKKADNYEK